MFLCGMYFSNRNTKYLLLQCWLTMAFLVLQLLIKSASALICAAEHIGNQMMLHLPFISSPASFCSSCLARKACLPATFVETGFIYSCTRQFSSLVKCLITSCCENMKGYRAVWTVRRWLEDFGKNKEIIKTSSKVTDKGNCRDRAEETGVCVLSVKCVHNRKLQ